MEKSTSWEVNRSSAGQEIPRPIWNPRFHYLIQKCPPPVSIHSQSNPVHVSLSSIFKVHFNINFLYARITSSYHESSITTCMIMCLFYLWDLRFPRRGIWRVKVFCNLTPCNFVYFSGKHFAYIQDTKQRNLHTIRPFAGHSKKCKLSSISTNFVYFYPRFLCSVCLPFHSLSFFCFNFGLHFTSLHFTLLHFTSLHFTLLHFTPLHFTSLHSLQFTSHHFTALQFTSLPFPSLPFPSFPFTSLHFIHFTSRHFNSHHLTTFQFTSLHCTSLNFTHPNSSLTSTLDVVGVQRHALTALPLWKGTHYPLCRRLGGDQGQSG